MSAPPTSDQTIYERPADLLQNLIRFDTTNPPDNETQCVAYINSFADAGLIEEYNLNYLGLKEEKRA
jgi:acetylornithine deacetylase/succinyl-diaminopimelate desuccinylase-like protein